MIDWDQVKGEVVAHLQNLIRIDTTNPPGNESEAARYLAGVLHREGLAPLCSESAPGRGNVTARWRGGSAPPLLLLGHTDVVGCEPEQWTHPPFGGEVHGGRIWGRGALDMKNMVAAQLMVVLLLARQGVRLNRDVLLAATADEEAGKGNHGIGWLLDRHPEQVDAPLVLTEGGGSDLRVGAQRFYTCQTGQKGICRLRVRARGRPGHGSMPHADSAILKICQALGRLRGAALPVHPSATMQAFVEGIAAHQGEEMASLWRAALDPARSHEALGALPVTEALREELGALLRNTASVNLLQGGNKINVIPAEAVALVDGRLAPGQTQESFLAELHPYLGEEVEVEVMQYSPALEASADTELFRAIEAVMGRHDPEAPVVPCLSTGGTDAKHICPRRPHTQIYGFMPYRQAPGEEEMSLIHGHDERISVENLLFATQVLYDLVCWFGGVHQADGQTGHPFILR